MCGGTVSEIPAPAEVEKRPCGGGDAFRWPAQEMKLCQSSGLLRLHILQVEAAHQEILTPDMFRNQVHLNGGTKGVLGGTGREE